MGKLNRLKEMEPHFPTDLMGGFQKTGLEVLLPVLHRLQQANPSSYPVTVTGLLVLSNVLEEVE
jgi:hypothetical protein